MQSHSPAPCEVELLHFWKMTGIHLETGPMLALLKRRALSAGVEVYDHGRAGVDDEAW